LREADRDLVHPHVGEFLEPAGNIPAEPIHRPAEIKSLACHDR
jgi:hypothetical protein